MSMQTITSKGIYHGLPTFPDDLTGPTAIVCGANGISGDHMLRVLCESPKRWTKIFALSRRPPNKQWPSHVEHVSMDFLNPPTQLAAQMNEQNIKADYVFFFAYVQPTPKEGGSIWSANEELVKLNTQLLQNFLTALTLTTLPKTILLQQGAKYYGLHLGPTTVPQEESDPRIPLEPNFYYPQEDTLKSFAQEHNISWIITRPSAILGAVPDSAMNICLPLAIYASIQKHLGKPLEYPADLASWEASKDLSSAQMNGYLAEWAVLTGNVNLSVNATNDCAFTWEKFWPCLAERFGVEWKGPDVDVGEGEGYKEVETCNPPPRGFGPPGKLKWRFTFSEWAKREEVQGAWRVMARRYGLRERELLDMERVFGFVDAVLVWSWPMQFSTTRRKKLGFFGFVDSTESVLRVLDEFVDLKMIPPNE
ncbi:hypothetical protein BO94DRAFT_487499 [Aspergillus sclerotioniger CBS 115572]|uniref:PRISE-like Rossmann-fold domain-containing protein n=1 Tax=Aspergillus sclerotioniger CBS 115572 TaxID=1450535 RepID=A0A317X5X2_9EURO|nr:hypothetical protein BO94DRAFT_487499 [Aspergillus sclerotioniger CBS 115572]PWY93022.1 hypothetical protein BO94DRAFT_487499 [Aspergillus sclerotioniger CBS 115572]